MVSLDVVRDAKLLQNLNKRIAGILRKYRERFHPIILSSVIEHILRNDALLDHIDELIEQKSWELAKIEILNDVSESDDKVRKLLAGGRLLKREPSFARLKYTASMLSSSFEKELLMKTLRPSKKTEKAKKFKICHISDLHLGKFNMYPDDFKYSKKRSRVLGAMTEVYDAEKPDFLLFTGDITSAAEQPLMRQFRTHLINLGKSKAHQIPRSRIIVQHGNHDILWPGLAEGDPNVFKNFFPGHKWNTVFSPTMTFASDEGFCTAFKSNYSDCQGAVFCYPQYRLAILALDSCYRSGLINEEALSKWKEIMNIDKTKYEELMKGMQDLIRLDTGTVDVDYVNEGIQTMNHVLNDVGYPRNEWYVCASLHHNLTQIRGVTVKVPAEYTRVRDILLDKAPSPMGTHRVVDNIFHGHVHTYDVAEPSPEIISASTLGGLYRPGNTGLNIIRIELAHAGEYRHRELQRYEWSVNKFCFERHSDGYIPI